MWCQVSTTSTRSTLASPSPGSSTGTTRASTPRQPSRQFATVEQIGGTVVYLCSPAADQVTGTTISVDGGWTAL